MHNKGSEWLSKGLYKEPSEFCGQVANLLWDLFDGIYHLDLGALNRADWTKKDYFEIIVGYVHWGTYDSDYLTRLVILAHEYGIKARIEPASPKYLRLKFYKVTLLGFFRDTHPTLDEAINKFYEKRKVKTHN